MAKIISPNNINGLVLALILLGGSFFVIPFAFAENGEDLEELKGKVANILEDRKCKHKKYGGICDLKNPLIKIISPTKGAKVPSPVTISGTASDTGSGIKNVKVKLNFGPFEAASYVGGTWQITKNLNPGFYVVIARAEDKVSNVSFDASYFRVIP